MSRRMTVEKANQIAKSKKAIIISKFKSSKSATQFKCTICGYEWTTSVYRLGKSQGCRKCNVKITTLDEANAIAKNKGVVIIGNYINASRPTRVKCSSCNYEWDVRIASLRISKNGCKKCSYKKNADKQRTSISNVKNSLDLLGIDYIDGFKNMNSKITVRYRSCGHRIKGQVYQSIMSGTRCPKCYFLDKKDYIALAEKYNGQLLRMAKNTSTPSLWKCPNGCTFERSYSQIKSAYTFCNECSKSFGERICGEAFFRIFNVRFRKIKLKEMRGERGGMLEFDLYTEIGKLKIAVEHQGSHHYRPRNKRESPTLLIRQKKHDEIKREYAKTNGIYLFEIPEIPTMTPISELKNVIKREAERLSLKLPQKIFKVDLNIDPYEIPTSNHQAYEELKSYALQRGYNLLENKFLGGHEFHRFLCPSGHEFKMKSYSFLQGIGCRQCYETENRQRCACSNGKLYYSNADAADDLDVSTGTISSAQNKKHLVSGHSIIRITNDEYSSACKDIVVKTVLIDKAKKIRSEIRPSKIAILTSLGELFISQSDFARCINVAPSIIAAACKRNGTVHNIGVRNISEEEYIQCLASQDHLHYLVRNFWPNGVVVRQKKLKKVIGSDGTVYKSIGACALALGVSISLVSTNIKKSKPIKGILFKKVN